MEFEEESDKDYKISIDDGQISDTESLENEDQEDFFILRESFSK